MQISSKIYHEILHTFPAVPPEAGGIIGTHGGVVSAFCYDPGFADMDRAVYTPDIQRLNRVIEGWNADGIRFCGILHTHPDGQTSLSGGDLVYIRRILEAIPDGAEGLYFPLVFPGRRMVVYHVRLVRSELVIRRDGVILTE